MFTIIGLILGALLGYLATQFLPFLEPLGQSGRQLLDKGRDFIFGLTANLPQGNLIAIAAIVVLFVLIYLLVGFSTALIIGLIVGVLYADSVGKLPFVSGIAGNLKNKMGGNNKID